MSYHYVLGNVRRRLRIRVPNNAVILSRDQNQPERQYKQIASNKGTD